MSSAQMSDAGAGLTDAVLVLGRGGMLRMLSRGDLRLLARRASDPLSGVPHPYREYWCHRSSVLITAKVILGYHKGQSIRYRTSASSVRQGCPQTLVDRRGGSLEAEPHERFSVGWQ
jgi:hypothetical protein